MAYTAPRNAPARLRRLVFLSHMSEDRAVIGRLSEDLRAYGLETWVDTRAIKGGHQWETSIRDAIEQSAFVLACYSSSYGRPHRLDHGG
jgi:hypothetical protein